MGRCASAWQAEELSVSFASGFPAASLPRLSLKVPEPMGFLKLPAMVWLSPLKRAAHSTENFLPASL